MCFVTLYAISLFWGTRGALLVVATSIAFNDSAAIAINDFVITPFYLGLVIVCGFESLRLIRRPNEKGKTRKFTIGALGGLFFYSAFVTAIGPWLFRGTGVVAKGIWTDGDVGSLNSLAPSISNAAQVAYLTLNVVFITFSRRHQLFTLVHVKLGLGIGTGVSFLGILASVLGFDWPHAFFDNSPRGMYAIEFLRLRAQFSEPSHLGAFSLTATIFFLVLIFQARAVKPFLGALALALMAATAFALSSSGGAVLGSIVAASVMVFAVIIAYTRTRGKIPIPPIAFLIGVVCVTSLVCLAPVIFDVIGEVVQQKQGGISLNSRNYQNQNSWQLFASTFGIGVGLGSSQTSSMFLMLIGSIGAIGTTLFLIVLTKSLREGFSNPQRFAAAAALIAFISSAFISLSDFSSPVMWSLIAVCISPSVIVATISGTDREAAPNIRESKSFMESAISTNVYTSTR